MNYRLKKISGDASFREFYRLKKGNRNSIIVKANKEKDHHDLAKKGYTHVDPDKLEKVLKDEGGFYELNLV